MWAEAAVVLDSRMSTARADDLIHRPVSRQLTALHQRLEKPPTSLAIEAEQTRRLSDREAKTWHLEELGRYPRPQITLAPVVCVLQTHATQGVDHWSPHDQPEQRLCRILSCTSAPSTA
jgi:hypothetical protein